MSITHDLIEGALYLGPIAIGVGLLAAYGRDRTADEHDLSDYHEPAVTVTVASDYLTETEKAQHHIRPAAALTGPVGWAAWEPEPARLDGPTPPIARAMLIDHAVPTLSDAAVRGIADEWLHEIGDAERAKAGIWPVLSPATDRDLTGAFAVVAVA